MKIYKYSCSLSEIEDDLVFSVPSPVKVLSSINHNENLCIYILVNEKGETELVHFKVYGTGHPVNGAEIGNFVGTVSFMDGSFVVHVFLKH